MKRVLILNFDCIMWSCIKLYEKYLSPNENPTVSWAMLEYELEIDKYLSYDAGVLKKIARILKANASAEVVPVDIPKEAVNELLIAETSLERLDIMDIYSRSEHHGDLTDDDGFGQPYDDTDCIGYLMQTGITDNVRWLRAPNSAASPLEPLSFTKCDIQQDELNMYDTIFFVRSPAIVPYKYQHLYDLLVEIFAKEG